MSDIFPEWKGAALILAICVIGGLLAGLIDAIKGGDDIKVICHGELIVKGGVYECRPKKAAPEGAGGTA